MDILKKIFTIMNKRQKIAMVCLFFIILVNSLLELLGISLVAPVVTVLQSRSLPNFAEVINSNIFTKIICNVFHIQPISSNTSKIITAMITVIIVIYIIKALYFVFVLYYSSLFTSSLSKSISTKLVKANLSMPYSYFINTNSSIIMRKCTSDVGHFISSVTGIINFITATLTSIAIFTYLMITSWKITLILAGFMIVSSTISVLLLKNTAKNTAIKMQRYNARNYQILHRSIYGIKETKIAETEDYFINQYYGNLSQIIKRSIKYSILTALPFQFIQNLAIIIVMIITIILVNILPASDTPFIITLLTAFVLAVVKLVPCIIGISRNYLSFSYFKPSINTIFDDLNEAKKIEDHEKLMRGKYGNEEIKFNKDILINNLSFSYTTGPIIIENVNVKINKGEYVAFSGNSGAGKTTLIDNLLGLLTPQEGNIYCDGRSIYENIKSWHSLLSYVPQTIFLLDDTIKANVCFGLDSKYINEDKVWEALEKAQLKEFVESLPNKLDSIIGESGVKLSGGQRQRIGIARAFYRDTPIMVLDEATSALDYQTEDNILLNIQKVKGDKTVIIITHRLNTISHCDKIYCIENHICRQIK